MKVLHVITNLETGGAEKLLVDFLPLLKQDCQVELALFQGQKTEFYKRLKDKGITIHSFSENRNVYHPKNIFCLAKLARKFDIVHTHNTACQIYGAIASLFSKAKWCTTEHTTTSRHRVWWFAPVEKWMYSRYTHVICISEATRQSMREVAGKSAPETTVICNGINIKKYHDAFPASDLKKDGKIITMVGRWSYQKDQATIIRAIAKLPKVYKLWLVGYGETEEVLRTLARKLCVNDRVLFLGLRNDVPNILKASDVVVQSSHIDGFGLAAVEGWAAGKPIIASDVEGLAQVVKDAGLLFPHEDADTLALEIEDVCMNKVLYSELVEKGYVRAAQYDISTMVEGYTNIYKTIFSK